MVSGDKMHHTELWQTAWDRYIEPIFKATDLDDHDQLVSNYLTIMGIALLTGMLHRSNMQDPSYFDIIHALRDQENEPPLTAFGFGVLVAHLQSVTDSMNEPGSTLAIHDKRCTYYEFLDLLIEVAGPSSPLVASFRTEVKRLQGMKYLGEVHLRSIYLEALVASRRRSNTRSAILTSRVRLASEAWQKTVTEGYCSYLSYDVADASGDITLHFVHPHDTDAEMLLTFTSEDSVKVQSKKGWEIRVMTLDEFERLFPKLLRFPSGLNAV